MATKNPIIEQTEKAMAPVKAINEVAVDTTEQLVELQMSALQNYAKMAITHWREALHVTDVEGMKTFAEKNREYLKTLSEAAAKDANAVVELGTEYVTEVQKILKESAEKVTKKAA